MLASPFGSECGRMSSLYSSWLLGTLHPQERGGFQGRPEGVTSAKSFMMQKSLFTTFVVPEGRVKNSEL